MGLFLLLTVLLATVAAISEHQVEVAAGDYQLFARLSQVFLPLLLFFSLFFLLNLFS
jgi:hypothetical protein